MWPGILNMAVRDHPESLTFQTIKVDLPTQHLTRSRTIATPTSRHPATRSRPPRRTRSRCPQTPSHHIVARSG